MKKQVLKAKQSSIDYKFMAKSPDGYMELIDKRIGSGEISLASIANAVVQKPSEELTKSVLAGMEYPVILVPNSEKEHYMAIRGLSNIEPYNPSAQYLTIIGNQRVTIAQNNDYTHIDAFIVDTGFEAIIVKHTYSGSFVEED